MAGHSKWANIKRHKAKQDAKRGKLYTKLIREITVAARISSDPNSPRLRAALDKAFEANMTKDVIDRAIKRGAGNDAADNLEEVRYEGYGPEGIAVIVDCMTNNRNRTVAEIRHAFSKHAGNLGTSGSVAYQFKQVGQMTFAPGTDEDQLMEVALELGVDDIRVNDDQSIDVITPPDEFSNVKEALIKASFKPEQADVTMLADNNIAITDKDTAGVVINLIDALEELDDVQSVYTNADIDAEV